MTPGPSVSVGYTQHLSSRRVQFNISLNACNYIQNKKCHERTGVAMGYTTNIPYNILNEASVFTIA